MPSRQWSTAAAALGAVLLLVPVLALAQPLVSSFAFHSWTNGHMAVKPRCVYKGVMSDAEIELCTGHPVHYDYGISTGEKPAARMPAHGRPDR